MAENINILTIPKEIQTKKAEEAKAKADEEAKQKKAEEARNKELQDSLFGVDSRNFDNFFGLGEGEYTTETFAKNTTGVFQALFAPLRATLKITSAVAGGVLQPLLGVVSPIFNILGKTLGALNKKTDTKADEKKDEKKTGEQKPATDKPATDKPATDKPASDKPAAQTPSSGANPFNTKNSVNYNAGTVSDAKALPTYGLEGISSYVRGMVEEYEESKKEYNAQKSNAETAAAAFTKAQAENDKAEEKNKQQINEAQVTYHVQSELVKAYKAELTDIEGDKAEFDAIMAQNAQDTPRYKAAKAAKDKLAAREKTVKDALKTAENAAATAKGQCNGNTEIKEGSLTDLKAKWQAAEEAAKAAKTLMDNAKTDVEASVKDTLNGVTIEGKPNATAEEKAAALKAHLSANNGAEYNKMTAENNQDTATADKARAAFDKAQAGKISSNARIEAALNELVTKKQITTTSEYDSKTMPCPTGVDEADWKRAIELKVTELKASSKGGGGVNPPQAPLPNQPPQRILPGQMQMVAM